MLKMAWAYNDSASIIQIDDVPGREQLREANELAGTAVIGLGSGDHDVMGAILFLRMKEKHVVSLSCSLIGCTSGDVKLQRATASLP
jgi:hypothetical protein